MQILCERCVCVCILSVCHFQRNRLVPVKYVLSFPIARTPSLILLFSLAFPCQFFSVSLALSFIPFTSSHLPHHTYKGHTYFLFLLLYCYLQQNKTIHQNFTLGPSFKLLTLSLLSPHLVGIKFSERMCRTVCSYR